MNILSLIYTKKEPFRLFTFIIIIYASYILLNIGNALNGIHLFILFGISILPVFLTKILYNNKKNRHGIHFDFTTLFLILLLVIWVSVIDYFFVEIFKITTASLLEDSSSYWLLLFSGIIPLFVYSFVTFYFVITRNLSNTIRFILVSIFILNSALNDFLYYWLFNIDLPDKWTWLYQPRILFGETITTEQLYIWMGLNLFAVIVIYLTPFEAITPDNLEVSDAGHQKKWIDYMILSILLFGGTWHALTFVPIIKNEIKKIDNEINLNIKNNQELLDIVNSQDKYPEFYITVSKNVYNAKIELLDSVTQYLSEYYSNNGSYPTSTGNCIQQWDSSSIELPFSTFQPKDIFPEGEKCDFSDNSNPILYYSDGTMYALLVSAQGLELLNNTLSEEDNFLYIPEKRDVMWFQNESSYFWKSWKWSSPMIVYMVISEDNITTFRKV
jgi:hypothetical protein